MGKSKEQFIEIFKHHTADDLRTEAEREKEYWQEYEEDMKQKDKEIEEKLWRLNQLIDEHISGADHQVGKALTSFITDNIRKHQKTRRTMKFPNLPAIFYDYFQKENPDREPQEQITFAPSYLTSCLRQTYYKKSGEKPSNPIDSPAYFKMHFGKIQHAELQRILKELGHLKSAEVKKKVVFEGLTFNYLYDGIVTSNGADFLIEIKTKYGRGIDAVKEHPDDDHVQQAVSYMIFENIPRCVIFYVGRDNGYAVQHILAIVDNQVYINGDLTGHMLEWKENITKMKRLRSMFNDRELPDRDFQIVLKNLNGETRDMFTKDGVKHKTPWQCSYCSFKDTCWSEELKEIKKHKYYINSEFI